MSEEGKGSTFTVSLPRRVADPTGPVLGEGGRSKADPGWAGLDR